MHELSIESMSIDVGGRLLVSLCKSHARQVGSSEKAAEKIRKGGNRYESNDI